MEYEYNREEAKENFYTIFDSVVDDNDLWVFCKDGKPVAIMISYEDYISMVSETVLLAKEGE